MNPVFLDTVGLVALWDKSDQWHDDAERAFSQMARLRQPTLTTTFVLLECGNAVARRGFRQEVALFRETLEKRNELIVPTADDWNQAWDSYKWGHAGEASIVDQISFVVMQRLGLTTAFTNDKHFKAAGFTALF
jgi:predicted nucleic acid-binding protein